MIDKEDILKGAIIGQLVGDAIGSYYLFSNEQDIKLNSVDMFPGPGDREIGMYSNASALTLCMISSINENNGLNLDDMLERFHDCFVGGYMNYNEGEGCYLSPTSSQAIKNFSNGMTPDRCGINSDDNEVLLRVLPISLYWAQFPIEEFIDIIMKTTRLTHNSISSDICCSLMGLILRNIYLEKSEKTSDVLIDYYKTQNMDKHLECIPVILEARDQPLYADNIINVFWAGWRIFSNNENNYRYCVSRAVRIGVKDDACRLNPINIANVLAGMVGTLNGLRNGLENIPYNWVRSLKLIPECMEIIQSFVDHIARKGV